MIVGRDDSRTAAVPGKVVLVAGFALLSLTILLVCTGAVLVFGGGGFGRLSWGLPGVSGLWALGFSMAGYPITRRHPTNPVGWCLMVAGAAAGVTFLGLSEAAESGGLAYWMSSAWLVSIGALCSAIVLFPSGSPPSRWWWAQLCVLWGSVVLTYFADPDELSKFAGLPGRLEPLAAPAAMVFQLACAAGCAALVVRWRRSGPTERLQLKWVMYGAAMLGMTALAVEVGIGNFAPDLHFPGTVVLSIVILVVPVKMGVAMLRYRLYDIDLVINRTLVYLALTATLALLYVGVVVSLQYAIHILTGGGSQLVIVASTLGIAALFNPLRSRIQGFVDRLFYRKKYDASRTLETFGAKLRHDTDLDMLSEDLVTVVRDTVQPERVSLWLLEPGKKADGREYPHGRVGGGPGLAKKQDSGGMILD